MSARTRRAVAAEQVPRSDGAEILCLGFGPNRTTDILRLNALGDALRPTHNIQIAAVGLANEKERDARHEIRFTYVQGNFRPTKEFLDLIRPNTVGIILDYFFINSTYYANDFGTNWTEKTVQAFNRFPNLKFLLLPNPNDVLVGMFSAFPRDSPLAVMAWISSPAAKTMHPLVAASLLAEIRCPSNETRETFERLRKTWTLEEEKKSFLLLSRPPGQHELIREYTAAILRLCEKENPRLTALYRTGEEEPPKGGVLLPMMPRDLGSRQRYAVKILPVEGVGCVGCYEEARVEVDGIPVCSRECLLGELTAYHESVLSALNNILL